MNFQSIAALWWMAPLGGFIIALYLLRMKRKNLQVPSTFLWPERVDEIRANSLFQKLKFNWLMVLQLLALALLVFGLARFQTRQKGLGGATTIVVLDGSASMGATDVSPTRFDAGLDKVRDMIASVGANDRLALILAGTSPRVVFPLSNDQGKMRQEVERLKPSDAESDIGEALRVSAAIVGQEKSSKIILISDGCFTPVENFTPKNAELVYTKIGSSSRNLAIQALGTSVGSQGRQIYVGVRNYHSEPLSGTLNLSADGKLLDSVKFTAEPNKVWGRTIKVPAGLEQISAKILAKDELEADNYRWISGEQSQNLRVLLVSAEDFFLEKALVLDPRVTLDRSAKVPSTEKAGSTDPSNYDIVIFSGVPSEPVKAPAVCIFGEPGSIAPVSNVRTVKAPAFLTSKDHPLLKGVDFESVYIDKAYQVKVKNRGTVLAESKTGPLLVISEGAQKKLYLSFEPLDSDFPLNYSFPIFIANMLDFLAETKLSRISEIRTGQVIGFPQGEQDSLKMVYPDGKDRTVEPAHGKFMLRNLDKIGRYLIGSGEDQRVILANLSSEVESRIEPKDSISVSGNEVAKTQVLYRFADLWRPLLLLGLAVLAGEWWLYAKRS